MTAIRASTTTLPSPRRIHRGGTQTGRLYGGTMLALMLAGTVAHAQETWPPIAPAFKSAGVSTACSLPEGMDTTAPSAKSLAAGYVCALPEMLAGYAAAGVLSANIYAQWVNYARQPYLSATHAERYANNYANDIAAAYGRYEAAGSLPVGSVIAKDTFSISAAGRVIFGPLFLMEKLAPPFSPDTGGWRYAMVMPTGWVFGETGGRGADNVRFCAECHASVAEENDSLFFMPPEVRK